MKVTIVVTHLLGSGHLARACTLARAFGGAGHRAVVVSGGLPVPRMDLDGVDLVQLPPVRSDGVNFARLLDAEVAEMTARGRTARRDLLLDHVARHPPDVLITELFPFGRRVLQDEFTALLARAGALPKPPLICASVRDILAPPSKPEKAARTRALLADHYDIVLVHSDPDLTPLEASWPVTPDMARKLRYTGFVAPPAALPHPDRLGEGEVIVSAGGGDVGRPVFDAALQAAAMDDGQIWRLLVGGRAAAETCADLASGAPRNAIIEPARPDFRQMLHHAAASVSLCGYNTALDLLMAGTPCVFVPFDAGGEVEQGLRATALSRLQGVAVVQTADLSAQSLAGAIIRVRRDPRRRIALTGLDGARRTVEIVQDERERRG